MHHRLSGVVAYTDSGRHGYLDDEECGTDAMGQQRTYSSELRTEAVKMVLEQGLTQQETGRRLQYPQGDDRQLGSGGEGRPSPRPSRRPLGRGAGRRESAVTQRAGTGPHGERDPAEKQPEYFAKEPLPGTRS